MASTMEVWNTPICCCSWVLNCVPRDFSHLLSVLCCKAVPGVGGTVCGVFRDNVSKRKGLGRGGDKNKFSTALELKGIFALFVFGSAFSRFDFHHNQTNIRYEYGN